MPGREPRAVGDPFTAEARRQAQEVAASDRRTDDQEFVEGAAALWEERSGAEARRPV